MDVFSGPAPGQQRGQRDRCSSGPSVASAMHPRLQRPLRVSPLPPGTRHHLPGQRAVLHWHYDWDDMVGAQAMVHAVTLHVLCMHKCLLHMAVKTLSASMINNSL